MDEGVTVDCVTKECHQAPLKAAEQVQRNADEAAYLSRQQASAEKATKRDAIMEKLAAVAEVAPDDLKEAFGARGSTVR